MDQLILSSCIVYGKVVIEHLIGKMYSMNIFKRNICIVDNLPI